MRNDDTAWWQKLYLVTNDDDDDIDNRNDLCISAADTDDYFKVHV